MCKYCVTTHNILHMCQLGDEYTQRYMKNDWDKSITDLKL